MPKRRGSAKAISTSNGQDLFRFFVCTVHPLKVVHKYPIQCLLVFYTIQGTIQSSPWNSTDRSGFCSSLFRPVREDAFDGSLAGLLGLLLVYTSCGQERESDPHVPDTSCTSYLSPLPGGVETRVNLGIDSNPIHFPYILMSASKNLDMTCKSILLESFSSDLHLAFSCSRLVACSGQGFLRELLRDRRAEQCQGRHEVRQAARRCVGLAFRRAFEASLFIVVLRLLHLVSSSDALVALIKCCQRLLVVTCLHVHIILGIYSSILKATCSCVSSRESVSFVFSRLAWDGMTFLSRKRRQS